MHARLLPAVAALATLALLPLAGCAVVFGHASITDDYVVTTVHTPAGIDVDSPVGSIDVEAWNKPNVRVEVKKRATTRDALKAIVVSVQPQGTTLAIKADLGDGNGSDRKVDLIIHAPAKTNLDLRQSVGAMKIIGFAGNVKADVNVGAIRLVLPASTSAKVTASVSVGAVKSAFPLDTQRQTVGETATGTIGSGSATIGLTAETGAIEIQRE